MSDTSEKFAKIIEQTAVQARKDECLDLPPLLRVPIPVEMSPEQKRIYEDMRKHFVAELEGQVVTAEFAMTKTLRMQQILAGFLAKDSESEAMWPAEVPRLDALRELLRQINGQKVIIWTNWRPTYAKIEEICRDEGYETVRCTGEQTPLQKQEAIDRFQRGSANGFIAHPAAGGAGLNLQASRYSIFYSRGYSLEHFLQSEGRNYRAGSNEKVTHYHLISSGTLDEVVANALLNKMNVGEAVLQWAKKDLPKLSASRITGQPLEVTP